MLDGRGISATDPVLRGLLQAVAAHAKQCGRDEILSGFSELIPALTASSEDPAVLARDLRGLLTEYIIREREGELMPSPLELLPGCKLWTLEAKRLLDEATRSHPWELSLEQQQYVHEGLLRRIKGLQGYVSIWPLPPSRARTRRDLELDFDLNVAIRMGRVSQPRCEDILNNLYEGAHTGLFTSVFEVLDLVHRGKRPRPEDFPEIILEIPEPSDTSHR